MLPLLSAEGGVPDRFGEDQDGEDEDESGVPFSALGVAESVFGGSVADVEVERPEAEATAMPRVAAAMSGVLIGFSAAPMPIAVTDSPRAMRMNRPWRSLKWVALRTRQLPWREVR